MGYIEKVMGEREKVVYRTHRHVIVLLQRIIGWLLLFGVFLGFGLLLLVPKVGATGNVVRWYAGLVVLGVLVVPVFWTLSSWMKGFRGRDLVKRIWRPALAGLAALIVAGLVMLNPHVRELGWIGVGLALFPLAQAIRILLEYLNEQYVITNRRVMEVRGIINKHVRDSALEKVNDVGLDQSFVGRLLRYGTVEIITGSDIGVNDFHRISNPTKFKRAMLNAKEQLHVTAPAIEAEAWTSAAPAAAAATPAPAAVAPAGGNIPDLIAELDDLRQKGIITEEEFKAKKQDLLARL